MMIVEIVLAISDKIRASPSWKGSIRKNQAGIYQQSLLSHLFINSFKNQSTNNHN